MAALDTLGWFQTLQKKYEYIRMMGLAPNYYTGNGPQAMEWGVKIHVSATLTSIEHLATRLLPYLNEQGVFHKVLATTELIGTAQQDNQRRKFITVYPQSADQLDTLADAMDTILTARDCPLRIGPAADCFAITGDLPYGRAGYLFLRYGNFIKDDASDDRSVISEKLRAYYMDDKVDGLFVAARRRY